MKSTTTLMSKSLRDPIADLPVKRQPDHSPRPAGLTQRAKANGRERIRHLEEERRSSELRPPFSAPCSRSRLRLLQAILIGCLSFSVSQVYALNIACPGDASVIEKQAAKEVRRYLFLRTGKAPELKAADKVASLPAGDVIVVAANSRPIITELKAEYGGVDAPSSDNRLGYLIKSVAKDQRNILVITGADTYTTLTAAYRFAELLGCHFNLAGDVIPDKKLSYPIPISGYDEKAQPWFELRGCLPFHNFTAGPDLWNTADYKSFIGQQAKMGFNFFGLHHYFRGGPGSQEGPEPHLWIGHKEDVNPDGTIKPEAAYKAYWASSFRRGATAPPKGDVPGREGEEAEELEPIWGEQSVRIAEFTNGTDQLFAHDHFGSEAIGTKEPTTPEEMAAVFNKVGTLLDEAFTHAKQLGVKTALGHEAPLVFEAGNRSRNEEGDEAHIITRDWIRTCPPSVRDRMRDAHGFTIPTSRGADNEAFAKALYEGIFTRISRTHPLDYYWVWTYECWAYNTHDPSPQQREAVADDYRYCNEVMRAMNVPFKMATFGWKVGSLDAGRALEFDDDLPKDIALGTLWDRAEGLDQVIEAGRKGWSSVWYEEDNRLIQPQLRATGVFSEVAAGLHQGGVQALIAKHWRMNSIAPSSAAHAQLSWDNRVSVADPMPGIADGLRKYPDFDPFTPHDKQDPDFVRMITTFYQDWAKANFGPERSEAIGALLAKADRLGEPQRVNEEFPKGAIPRSSRSLPSAIMEVWPEDGDIASPTDPKFLDAMHVYTEFCKHKDAIVGAGNKDRYMYWYHFFKGQIELCKLAIVRSEYADEDHRLPSVKEKIMETWDRFMSHEIQRIRNESELAVIAQLQRSTWDAVFRNDLGIRDISCKYEGERSVRAMPEISQVHENETFEQKVLFIGNGTIANPAIHYRKMGSTDSFQTLALIPEGKRVMKARIPYPGHDFEYFIQGSVGGDTVTYPVTGGSGTGNINKTVITVEKVAK